MLPRYFEKVELGGYSLDAYAQGEAAAKDLFALKSFLEYTQIEAGLLRPYSDTYPLIEPRELEPPFDPTLLEYKNLPGFSMVALDRVLDYQEEPFQFDLMEDPGGAANLDWVRRHNRSLFLSRLPRPFHDRLRVLDENADVTSLAHYGSLLPIIFNMDRGHVIARSAAGDGYRLLGLYASFPSDLDRQIKRFGVRIGKFRHRDNNLYARNRIFVYRYLMELHGFPIASERRTSAAMFANRLIERDENFFISVLGNSDRVVTFLSSRGRGRWPLVEKIALVRVEPEARTLTRALDQGGYFLDRSRGVIILKVTYVQHEYNPDNIIEDRALSVVEQEAIHPVTGTRFADLSVLKTASRRLVRLNDIVRGEHQGQIVYDSREVVYGTEDHVSRLKFLHAWLTKHRRALLGYSERAFRQMDRTLSSYLDKANQGKDMSETADVYHAVYRQVEMLRQEYQVVHLKRTLMARDASRRRMTYRDRLATLLDFLYRERELTSYHAEVFEKLLFLCDGILDSSYFKRRYRSTKQESGSSYEKEVLDLYQEVMTQRNQLEWKYFRALHASSAV